MTPPVVLTIAGSDSGGGAGIQADLKTFAALGTFGVSAVTAVTAQNTLGVTAVHHVPAEIVAAQLDAILADFAVVAVKVGMIGTPGIVEVLLERVARLPHLVVDPVLVSTSGSRLSAAEVIAPLLSYAQVVTPNRHEAGALGDHLSGLPGAVIVTGSETGVDAVTIDGRVSELRAVPVVTENNHGSGCTFSSAVAARLALGDPLPAAIRAAKEYVTGALSAGRGWKLGAGPGPLNHFWMR